MLTIREASFDDARRLFDWRNDEETRRMSRDPSPLDWDRHCAWLERVLASDAHRLVIALHDGEPVASVRFDYGEETEYSIVIAPAWRGRGLATDALRLALGDEEHCVGYTRDDNIACQKMMRNLGFTMVEGGEMQKWVYRRQPDAQPG